MLVQGRLRKGFYTFTNPYQGDGAHGEEPRSENNGEAPRETLQLPPKRGVEARGDVDVGNEGGVAVEGEKTSMFLRNEVDLSLSDETVINYAAFPIHKPPMAKREIIEKIPRFDATLGPGDVLFLPAMWWHEVTAIPDQQHGCVGVSHQFHPFYARAQGPTACDLGPMLTNPMYEDLHGTLSSASVIDDCSEHWDL